MDHYAGTDDFDLAQERAARSLSAELVDERQATYLRAVQSALSDRHLTRDEIEAIKATAQAMGLTKTERVALHQEFLKQTAITILISGELTLDRQAELAGLAKRLGLDTSAVIGAVHHANVQAEQFVNVWRQALQQSVDISVPAAPAPEADPTPAGSWFGSALAIAAAVPTASLATAQLAVNQIRSSTAALGGTLQAATRAALLTQELPCCKCRQPAPHAFAVGKSFPVGRWLQVAWEAKSLSPAGFLANAAVALIADRQLLQQTGQSLLPRLSCRRCGTQADAWESAQVLFRALAGATDIPERAKG